MGMQQNAWMTRWLFESWISHFLEYLKAGPGIDHSNRHLLILDGHNSHVTLEVVKISMQSGLDIISFPSHTSHALQPLDVVCFKPFKTTFRRCRDLWSLENNKKEVGKQDLCEWTSRALRVALTPNNIRAGFQSTRIWPLDRTAVRDKMHAAAGFAANCEDLGAGQGGCGVTRPAGYLDAATGDGSNQLVTEVGRSNWPVPETRRWAGSTSAPHPQVWSSTPRMAARRLRQRANTMRQMSKCTCAPLAMIETTAFSIFTWTFLTLTKVRTTLATEVWALTLVSTHSCERMMTMTLAHSLHFLS